MTRVAHSAGQILSLKTVDSVDPRRCDMNLLIRVSERFVL